MNSCVRTEALNSFQKDHPLKPILLDKVSENGEQS